MVQLSDTSDVSDPVGHSLLESLHELRILDFVLEVIGCHLSTKGLAFFRFESDVLIMLQLYFGNEDVLLALHEMDLELSQILLDVLETGGRWAHVIFGTLVGLVRVEQRQERVLYVSSCQFKDVEVFTDVSEVDELQLLRGVVTCLISSQIQESKRFSLQERNGMRSCTKVLDFEGEFHSFSVQIVACLGAGVLGGLSWRRLVLVLIVLGASFPSLVNSRDEQGTLVLVRCKLGQQLLGLRLVQLFVEHVLIDVQKRATRGD